MSLASGSGTAQAVRCVASYNRAACAAPLLFSSTGVVIYLLLLTGGLCAEERLCRTTNGDTFSAEPVSIAGDGDVVFAVAGGQKQVPAGVLLTWGSLSDTPDGTQVLLADGSLIVASDVQLDGESLIVRANLFGEVDDFSIAGISRIPVSTVRAVVFRVPLRGADRDALFNRIESAAGIEDQLWLANGDVLKGTLAKLTRERSGDRPGPMQVTMTTSAGDVTIGPDEPQGKLLEKVQAVIFNPSLVRKISADGSFMLLGLSDGSRLYVQQFDPRKKQATFKLRCGTELQSHPDEDIWRKLASLQSFGPHVRYLSDLDPAPNSYRHTPLVGRTWPLGEDANVTGGKLRAGGKFFAKGLGMHSSSRAVYVLDQPYARLEAELSIDESAGNSGSVNFLVAHDAGGKFQIVHKSEIIRGGDSPTFLSIDLTGARRLAIFVEPADRGDVLDRANWGSARLIPAAAGE